jgi:aryl-alcohol dehydrogenase-like predicted oxidoreductase
MKSKIIIGTWPLSGDYGNISLEEIQKNLEFCYKNGLKEFDTAPNYGNGFMEFCLGKVFQDKLDVKINTKIGNTPFGKKNFEIKKLKESLDESLKRLKRQSISTLFLHNPRDEILNYDEIIDFLEDLKKENIIEFIGLSKAKDFDYNNKVNLNRFDVIQDDVNLLSLDSVNKQKPVNTIFMARSPLASGLLSGKITNSTTFPSDDHRHLWLKEDRLKSLLRRIEVIKENSEIDLPTLAMKFVLNLENVDKVIFGIKKIEHVKKIIDVNLDYELDHEIINKFKDLYKKDFGLINEKDNSY